MLGMTFKVIWVAIIVKVINDRTFLRQKEQTSKYFCEHQKKDLSHCGLHHLYSYRPFGVLGHLTESISNE